MEAPALSNDRSAWGQALFSSDFSPQHSQPQAQSSAVSVVGVVDVVAQPQLQGSSLMVAPG
jgi:hypothetical protein